MSNKTSFDQEQSGIEWKPAFPLGNQPWFWSPCARANLRLTVPRRWIDLKFLFPKLLVPYEDILKGFYNRTAEFWEFPCTLWSNKPCWFCCPCAGAIFQVTVPRRWIDLKILFPKLLVPYTNILKGFYNRTAEFWEIPCTLWSNKDDRFQGSDLWFAFWRIWADWVCFRQFWSSIDLKRPKSMQNTTDPWLQTFWTAQ